MKNGNMYDAAKDFARQAAPQEHNAALRLLLMEVFEAGAKWQAEQSPTDEEVLAALNAENSVLAPKSYPADDLELFGETHRRAMLNALLAAQAVRKGDI